MIYGCHSTCRHNTWPDLPGHVVATETHVFCLLCKLSKQDTRVCVATFGKAALCFAPSIQLLFWLDNLEHLYHHYPCLEGYRWCKY